VVLTSTVETGEIIPAGYAVMTIADLSQLTVTVYIPEDRYGQINLGDQADLMIDSFPDEVFEAQVIRISDQAEYTPRNVQTQEERQNTVYAVELTVLNPGDKLKPGMPADVVFQP
jgi:HlyD family secretion protein